MRCSPQILPALSRRCAGSVLIATLMIAGILVLTLGGYLWWVRSQNLMVAQSQAWSAALAAAEAGIEEGLAQINVSFDTNYLVSLRANWPPNSGGLFGPRSCTLAGSSYTAFVLVTNPGPTIIATGFASAPVISRPVSRAIQVTTVPAALFPYALGAQELISAGGHSVAIDSYDSSDPAHSSSGLYYAPLRKAGGDVASAGGFADLRNGLTLHGKLRTGPQSDSSLGSGGLVGNLTFPGPGIQPGWYVNDFNQEFKSVRAPDTRLYVPPIGDAVNKYVLPASGGYLIHGDLTLDSGETLLVGANVHATILVTGNVSMEQQSAEGNAPAAIMIQPGGRLVLYVAGPKSDLASIQFVNHPGQPSDFQYFGLPTNANVTWISDSSIAGNTNFVGLLYAPQAQVTLGATGEAHTGFHHHGGTLACDYQGSCMARTITLNGPMNFHYDEALKRAGPACGFVVTTWREL